MVCWVSIIFSISDWAWIFQLEDGAEREGKILVMCTRGGLSRLFLKKF